MGHPGEDQGARQAELDRRDVDDLIAMVRQHQLAKISEPTRYTPNMPDEIMWAKLDYLVARRKALGDVGQ
jgi:Zn-finger nucleic acid-binding protein